MTDTDTNTTPTDNDLIQASAVALAALHEHIDAGTDEVAKGLLAAKHTADAACLERYNEVYAPEGETVMVARSGGGKPD